LPKNAFAGLTAAEKKAFLDMAQTWIKAAAKLTNGHSTTLVQM
jgi:hypothetical protein